MLIDLVSSIQNIFGHNLHTCSSSGKHILDIICIRAHPQVRFKRTIVHKLQDYHGWVHLGHHSIQLDDMVMVELAYDGRFIQKVSPHLSTRSRLETKMMLKCRNVLCSHQINWCRQQENIEAEYQKNTKLYSAYFQSLHSNINILFWLFFPHSSKYSTKFTFEQRTYTHTKKKTDLAASLHKGLYTLMSMKLAAGTCHLTLVGTIQSVVKYFYMVGKSSV